MKRNVLRIVLAFAVIGIAVSASSGVAVADSPDVEVDGPQPSLDADTWSGSDDVDLLGDDEETCKNESDCLSP